MNSSDCITPRFKFDDSSHPQLIRFEQFYQKLRLIVSRSPSPKHRPGEPLDTTPPTQMILPAPPVPTTPPPSTNPINPQYSSSSNVTASSAAESTDEHFIQSLANEFVYGSYKSLIKSLESVAWYRETKYDLQHGYAAKRYLANSSDHQKMHVKLNNVKVTADSDGGLSLQPDPSRRCLYPVFSIEVFAPAQLSQWRC